MRRTKPKSQSKPARLLQLFFALALFMFFNQTASAQSDAPYTGADVVVIVDQSGSMGGYANCLARSVARNDPEGLRFQAAQHAATWLANFGYYATSDAEINVAAIYFGNYQRGSGETAAAITRVGWTKVGDRSKGLAAYNQQNADLEGLLSQETYGSRDMCNTNFQAAFDEAQKLFDTAPTPEEGRHVRAIILLTDGYPCAPERPEWTNNDCASQQDQITHLTNLRDFTRNAFPSPDYEIYVVALDNGTTPFWPANEDLWQGIVNRDSNDRNATAVDTPDAILPEFHTILRDITDRISTGLVRVEPPLVNGVAEFQVLPYLSYMFINVYKTSTEPITIEVTNSLGQPIRAGDAGVETTATGETIQSWIIQASQTLIIQPGTWKVTTPPDVLPENVRVNIEQGYINANITPSAEPYYEWMKIDYTPELLLRASGTDFPLALSNYPSQYSLRITPRIQRVGGDTLALPDLTRTGDSFSGSFTPLLAGDYTIALCGIAQKDGVDIPTPVGTLGTSCGAGNVFTPLNTIERPTTLTVLPINKSVRLDEAFAATSTWFKDAPGKVYFDITDPATGQWVPNITGIKVRGTLIQAATGGQTTVEFIHQPDPVSSRASFIGEFKAASDGQHLLRVEVVELKSDGSEGATLYTHPDWPLNIQPVRQLELRVIAPEHQGQTVQSDFINIFSPEPLKLSVAVVDAQTNEAVEIGKYLTTPIEKPISGGYTRDGVDTPTTLDLTSPDNIFFTYQEGFGVGNYAFTFSLPANAVETTRCGCALVNPSVSIQVVRGISSAIWGWVAAGVGLLALVIGIAFAIARSLKGDDNPMTGDLMIDAYDTNNIPVNSRTIALTPRKKNKIVLKARDKDFPFPKNLNIRSLTITNNGFPEWASEGRVNVIFDDGIAKQMTVDPNTSQGDYRDWVALLTDNNGVTYYVRIIGEFSQNNGDTELGDGTTEIY